MSRISMDRYGVPGDAWDHRPSLDSLAEQERMADGSAFTRPYSYAPPGQGRMKSSSSLKFSDQVVDTGLSYHTGGDQDSPAGAAEYREYQQHMVDQQQEMEYAQHQQQQQGQGHHYPPPIQTQGQYADEEYEHEPHQGQIAPSGSSPSHYSSSHAYEHQPQQMPMPMPMAPPEYSSGYAQAHDGGAVASGGPSRGDGKHGYVAR
ncbi:hypothetical protein QFC24_000004 [Naganishia onofrii]|uniref:Uncharacterized protein n=1 Tax=Naganishia onofrii TaxID=1851511 RepID=A0ACC2XX97_9TREE|nr:hypothetical protein QFC24_000004 [Naganishia onofrii]